MGKECWVGKEGTQSFVLKSRRLRDWEWQRSYGFDLCAGEETGEWARAQRPPSSLGQGHIWGEKAWKVGKEKDSDLDSEDLNGAQVIAVIPFLLLLSDADGRSGRPAWWWWSRWGDRRGPGYGRIITKTSEYMDPILAAQSNDVCSNNPSLQCYSAFCAVTYSEAFLSTLLYRPLKAKTDWLSF